MSEHKHNWAKKEGGGISRKCSCGAILCSSLSPDGRYSCNLEIGHTKERCQNTSWPTGGTWDNTNEPSPLVKVMVYPQGDRYIAGTGGNASIYASGKTRDEALGKWMRLYGELVNVEVEIC